MFCTIQEIGWEDRIPKCKQMPGCYFIVW